MVVQPRSRRPGWYQWVTRRLRRLAVLLGFKRVPASAQKRRLQDWKDQRQRIVVEVRNHLAADQPLLAIKKLTRALLEDPQHPPYFNLLRKAVVLRRRRRLKQGHTDPWVGLPKHLQEEALSLEAFSVYINEVEQIFDKAGIPSLSSPPPRGKRKASADNESLSSQELQVKQPSSKSGHRRRRSSQPS